MKKIHIIGGGTVHHIANHFAVCAPAYGHTAAQLERYAFQYWKATAEVELTVTKMAGGDKLETNDDVENFVKEIVADPDTKVVFFNCALVDFNPLRVTAQFIKSENGYTKNSSPIGKYASRLETKNIAQVQLTLGPQKKIVKSIREKRKDIFLVAFKTTCGATSQEMYEKGLRLCKEGSCNLVLVNDTKTRNNMIVTPEEAAYHETTDRGVALQNLVNMAFLRSHLTFTQSTVVDGKLVSWKSEEVPKSLRTVVDYCVAKNAYKPFLNATVGHFAHKLSDTEFLTSIRKSNFNELEQNGLVRIKTDGPDTVVAYGAKPSVGGQSQRIVFKDHPGYDCIVHFHCPLKAEPKDVVNTVSQREVECGSHECGKNTSNGLRQYTDYGGLKAVYLSQHGPNIVFNKDIDPALVISFIENNFDLHLKTGGYNLNAENKN
jgi:hypothetical protein